jgi:hypothetical protein
MQWDDQIAWIAGIVFKREILFQFCLLHGLYAARISRVPGLQIGRIFIPSHDHGVHYFLSPSLSPFSFLGGWEAVP